MSAQHLVQPIKIAISEKIWNMKKPITYSFQARFMIRLLCYLKDVINYP